MPVSPPGSAAAAAAGRISAGAEALTAFHALPAGSLVKGTVLGGAAGHVRIRTDHGTVTLRIGIELAKGTSVTLEIRPGPFAAALVRVAAPRGPSTGGTEGPATGQRGEGAPPALIGGRGWPALEAVIRDLTRFHPRLAAAVLAAVPRPGPGLATALAAFVQSLHTGEIRRWLGEKTWRELARAGGADRARQLAHDVAVLARLAEDRLAGDWQAFLIPLFHGEAVRRIALFARSGRRRRKAKGGADESVCFLVEAEATAFGDIQLDGRVDGARFALILRSRMPLSRTLRQAVEETFRAGCAVGQLKGRLTFVVAANFPASPLRDLEPRPVGAIVV